MGQDPALEDDGAFLLFSDRLSEKLIEAMGQLTEVIDADYRELLGLAGTLIFTNLRHQHPNINLLNVLRKVLVVPASSPSDSAAAAIASLVREVVTRILVIYERLGASIDPAPAAVDSDEESGALLAKTSRARASPTAARWQTPTAKDLAPLQHPSWTLTPLTTPGRKPRKLVLLHWPKGPFMYLHAASPVKTLPS
jgi:hypothetical protein